MKKAAFGTAFIIKKYNILHSSLYFNNSYN
jgi:hypothetical protein